MSIGRRLKPNKRPLSNFPSEQSLQPWGWLILNDQCAEERSCWELTMLSTLFRDVDEWSVMPCPLDIRPIGNHECASWPRTQGFVNTFAGENTVTIQKCRESLGILIGVKDERTINVGIWVIGGN